MNRSMSCKAALLGSVIAFSGVAAASATGSAQSSSGCTMPAGLNHPLTDRDGGLAQYAGMPESCLKIMYLYCSAESERVVLGQQAMMVCSLGHEALLKRVFGGDLDALLAWWRTHREPRSGD